MHDGDASDQPSPRRQPGQPGRPTVASQWSTHPRPGEQCEVVLEVLEGVVPFVLAELARTDGVSVVDEAPTEVRVLADRPGAALGLRTVVAAYLVVALDVRRPRSMLSPDRMRQLTDGIAVARRTARPARFDAMRFSAAGSDSPEFIRLSEALTAATGLPRDDEDGDLLLRFRRRDERWEALVRLTPRPLSARSGGSPTTTPR